MVWRDPRRKLRQKDKLMMFGKSSMSAEELQSSWMAFRPAWRGRGTPSNIRAIRSKTLKLKKYFSFCFSASPAEQKYAFGTGSNRSAWLKFLKATEVLGDMSRRLEEAEGSSSESAGEDLESLKKGDARCRLRRPPQSYLPCVNTGGAAALSQEQEGWMKRTADDLKHLSSDKHGGSPVEQRWEDHAQQDRRMRAETSWAHESEFRDKNLCGSLEKNSHASRGSLTAKRRTCKLFLYPDCSYISNSSGVNTASL